MKLLQFGNQCTGFISLLFPPVSYSEWTITQQMDVLLQLSSLALRLVYVCDVLNALSSWGSVY